MIHPAGDGAHQPKSLRLCNFTALRWFNWPFITHNPKKRPLFQNLIRCTNRAIGDEIALVLQKVPQASWRKRLPQAVLRSPERVPAWTSSQNLLSAMTHERMVKTMKNLLVIILAVSLAGAMSAKAQPLAFVNPPGTTWSPPWVSPPPYQRNIYWNFSVNPVGGPTSAGTPGAVYGGTLDPGLMSRDSVAFTGNVRWLSSITDDEHAGYTNVIAIDNRNGNTTLNGTAEFTLANTQNASPQKNIWVEYTGVTLDEKYTDPDQNISVVPQVPGDPSASIYEGYIGTPTPTESQKSGATVFLLDYGFIVEPNPASEVVVFNFSVPAGECTLIDSLQIATECPEPSTVALLGIGTLSLLAYEWRRRKAKA